MSPLRKKMQDEMVLRGFAQRTQETYIGSLSEVLCVRHNMMSERTMYAKTRQEDAKSQRRCASKGVAEDTAGTA
jgi:hypothetical protein